MCSGPPLDCFGTSFGMIFGIWDVLGDDFLYFFGLGETNVNASGPRYVKAC